MQLIGLTGGIGSGKSTVSRLLASYGARIVDADHITHQLEERGQTVWDQIRSVFGWSVLRGDGTLDRKRLGYRVFSNTAERERLNAIVHPAVRQEMARQVDVARHQQATAVVLDVPLLIEGGLYQMVDEVWVVYVEPEQQVRRIQERDGVSSESAWQRIQAQMPLKDKLPFAHRVIDNRGGFSQMEEVVKSLWQNVAAGA